MNHTLHAVSAGEGENVLLLHGLFGQGSNLRSVARALENEFRVHCLDLPDHGRSLWLRHTSLEAYAQAVIRWMSEQQLARAHIIGHSLGGKVAMQLALNHRESLSSLVVADISPVRYSGAHEKILAAMASVEAQRCQTRTEAEGILAKVIDDPSVIGYLMMSLTRADGYYEWKLNLRGLSSGYEQLRAVPSGSRAFDGPTLFVKGSDSQYIQAEHESEISRRFPRSNLIAIEGAGHWVHVDQPQAFCHAVREHLIRFSSGERPA